MKKIIVILASAVLFATSAFAEFRIGISAAFTNLDTDGYETVKSSGTKNSKSITEQVVVPSVLFEVGTGLRGIALGIDYIPSAEQLGSGTGDDDDTETSGANKASADIEAVTTIYVTIPFNSFYFKAGVSSADITTTENLKTGTAYGNTSVDGTLIGVGYTRDMDDGFSWRLEYTQTDFDHLKITGTGGGDSVNNTIDADIDATALRFTLVKAF